MMNRAMLSVGCAMLAGCATMSPEECLQANWEEVGYNDGAAGYPVSRSAEHREACAETGGERLLLNCRVKGDPVHDAGLDTPEAQASAACQHAELQRLRRAKRLGQAKGLGRAGDAAV